MGRRNAWGVGSGGARVIDDSRFNEVLALLDEARTILVDVVDERPLTATLRDFNSIDAARQFINAAIPYVQSVLPTPEVVA